MAKPHNHNHTAVARVHPALKHQAAMTGMKHCTDICSPDDVSPGRYAVNRRGVQEKIYQPLYDSQLYPAAGTGQMTFFQVPVGGGATAKTLSNTNMKSAGQMPSPQSFLIKEISIQWYPGQTTSAPVQGPVAAATVIGALNDMAKVFRTGYLSLDIGSKNYLQHGPLDQFPPRSHLNAAVAITDATTAASALCSRIEVPFIDGEVYEITPIMLEPNQNFSVTLNWPEGVQSLPSSDALAIIEVTLWGLLFRPVQ